MNNRLINKLQVIQKNAEIHITSIAAGQYLKYVADELQQIIKSLTEDPYKIYPNETIKLFVCQVEDPHWSWKDVYSEHTLVDAIQRINNAQQRQPDSNWKIIERTEKLINLS